MLVVAFEYIREREMIGCLGGVGSALGKGKGQARGTFHGSDP